MSNESFASDDDLFSYDPSVETAKPQSSFEKNNSEILQNISKKIEENKDEDLIGSLGLRVKMAESILASYAEFIKINSVFFNKSVHQVLDQLTDGNFSLIYSYNFLESNIVRRINIKFLLQSIFLEKGKSSEQFKKFMSKFDLGFDESFVDIYINPTLMINDHIINNERAMYVNLAIKLNRTPSPVITNPDPKIEDLIALVPSNVHHYHHQMFESIQESLPDYIQDLSFLYSGEVKLSAI